MPQTESKVHGQVVAGAGATAANQETVIGTITLPANENDWNIYGVWCMNVRATATAGESIGGNFRFNTPLGNVDPQPNPSRLPTAFFGSFLGAVADVSICPLKIWDVNYTAAGRAQIEAIYNEASAVTVASQVVIGILYGDKKPDMPAITAMDRIRAAINSVNETQVGTFTLPQKATRIIGAMCVVVQDGVLTAGEELIGFFRLDSNDAALQPMQLPFAASFGAGLGATINNMTPPQPFWIPLDIPVKGGTNVDAFVKLNTALTNAAEFDIFIAYEL